MTNAQLNLVILGLIMRKSFIIFIARFQQLPETTDLNCLKSKKFSGIRDPWHKQA